MNFSNEPAYLLGLYSRVVSAWLLVLFALNRRYPVIDKGGGQSHHVVSRTPGELPGPGRAHPQR